LTQPTNDPDVKPPASAPAPSQEPIFNVPGVVVALLAVMVAVHLGRQLLSETTDDWLVLALALIPARYDGAMMLLPGKVLAAWTSPITHMFVHGDMTHLILNGASLLAFGGVIARRLPVLQFLLFALFVGLCGALAFFLANPGEPAPMIGASGAISGLMAAALRLMFGAIDQGSEGQAGEVLRHHTGEIKLMSLTTTLQDRRIQTATLVWLMINGFAAFGLGTPGASGAIAWEAHVGGYFAGLLALGAFDVRATKRQ
jgi:membrane associated rhomboid family serine protease